MGKTTLPVNTTKPLDPIPGCPFAPSVPPSIEAWNSRLEYNGEFLALASIACLSAPAVFDILLLGAVLVIFVSKMDADAGRFFPPSLKELQKKAKNGILTDEEHRCRSYIYAQFFRWRVVRKSIPIYFTSVFVFLGTIAAMASRYWLLLKCHLQ